jgi:hypothetical protein
MNSQELFEDRVFCDYFVKGISIGAGKQFADTNNNLFANQLCERTPDGRDYVREEISAMWNGWKLAIKFHDRLTHE